MKTEQLQGLWRRDWLRTDDYEDNTTRVYWAQCGNLFVDVRIPLKRADVKNKNCLAQLDTNSLEILMRSEGFAGTTTLADDICTWHRQINWQGKTDSIDAGHLWFDQLAEVLIEDGVHAHYREQWRKVSTPEFSAQTFQVEEMSGILLSSSAMFVLGIGNKNISGPATNKEQINPVLPTEASTHFASEYCIGLWDGDLGVVELSTNPFREGHAVLDQSDDGILWRQQTFDGAEKQHRIV
ncbi:MAG: hypothetical protein AB8B87_16830 [Granulosicoccus sp.]